jgi:hypothetical protein
MIDNPQISEP